MATRLKCEKCKHKEVCSLKSDMENIKSEVEEIQKKHYDTFRVSVDCQYYLDEKTPTFAPGIR